MRELHHEHSLVGTPRRGLGLATFGFGAGLTSIVLYGVAGPEFKNWLGLSGTMLGVLIAAPHLSKAVLRIPFGAAVDTTGGRRPLLLLLILTSVGMVGVAATLAFYFPGGSSPVLYPALLVFGLLAGAGGATFSVGAPQTAYCTRPPGRDTRLASTREPETWRPACSTSSFLSASACGD